MINPPDAMLQNIHLTTAKKELKYDRNTCLIHDQTFSFDRGASMNRIRQLRMKKKMTQQEVGEALGVGNTAVSMYENGHRRLDDDLIRILCTLFGCSADYLLGLTDYQPSLTEKDARHLEAYHAADKKDREAIDQIMQEAGK